eukprot:CAMPEP_0177588788 /NCGR_PEP_ID=MMETSP0419_2-20121207/6424_1 /TAXON_ID=582737 /ORGANISM="Tetraselmis sp., Strain GSL018" /LENGTH=121 /DNA_ID=CAMNT_0019079033 /DNA_START=466 /DNA_END=831 /DNA_ORIENTATION=-
MKSRARASSPSRGTVCQEYFGGPSAETAPTSPAFGIKLWKRSGSFGKAEPPVQPAHSSKPAFRTAVQASLGIGFHCLRISDASPQTRVADQGTARKAPAPKQTNEKMDGTSRQSAKASSYP